MINDTIDPVKYPLCEDIIERINNQFINNGWITLYDETYTYAVLISNDKLEKTRYCDGWELNINYSHPTINEFKDSVGSYSQYYEDGVVPIVTIQSKKSTYNKRIRLSDEFILFYDLRDVQNNDGIEYFIIDECGDGECIAKITPNQVVVQVKYIKEFIAIKEMSLLIQFETLKYSEKTLNDNGYTKQNYQVYNTDEYVFGYSLMDSGALTTNKSSALIRGKVWIMPDKKNIKRLWNYQDNRKENFIIGVNENGDNIEITCDENQLPNLFTRKGEEPYTLTLVFFKKEVLSKYYDNPEKYSIYEGYMCAPEWLLRFDNDRTDNYVVAVLVDLGKIPYKEQQHWKHYNVVAPSNASISETTKKRWFLGEPCDTSNAPDHLFKFQLKKTNDLWKSKFGWELFKPLAEKDQHHLESLHTMLERDNDKEFDGLIQSITKIIIDSLNEKEITNTTDSSNNNVISFLKSKDCSAPKDLKGGIAKFEAFLISLGQSNCDIIAQFKDIQELRSTTVAHRKSSNPDKKQQELFARFELDKLSQQDAFNKILLRLIDNMKFLQCIAEKK